ncbi:MAG: NfeD family protein [Lachnospiraceae bacterium]|nr:NfeD family protein [Lachnospiraceae bacterium]
MELDIMAIIAGGMAIVWLVLLLVFAVTEFLTQGITTIWFAIAAGVSLLLALIGAPIWLQVVVFVVLSAVLLIVGRQILVKKYNNSLEKTNVEAVIGQTALVIEDIDGKLGAGRVIIGGMEWAAAPEEANAKFAKDAQVTVVDVKGVKVIVK